MHSVVALAKQQKYFLLALFVLSLCFRLFFFKAFLQDNSVQLAFDSGHYHHVAVSMVQGKGFSDQEQAPYFYRLPGYPVFLSLCYSIFGINPNCALLMQIVLASLIPVVMFLLVLTCLPSNLLVAKAAAIVSMVHLGFLIMSGLVMSETLFMIMFLLFLLLFCAYIFTDDSEVSIKNKPQEKITIFFAGIFLGLASLIRPVGLILVLFACAALYFCASHRSIKKPLLLFAGWFLVISFWLARNFLLTGAIFFNTLSGPHCINHGAVRVVMAGQHCSWYDAQSKVKHELELRYKQAASLYGRPLQEIEASNIAQSYAFEVFKQYPLQTLKLCSINMIKTVFSLYSSELLFIDSGGQLPPYQEGRGIRECVMRFLNPEVRNKRIIFVIYAEIIMHLILLFGFFCCCVRLLFTVQNRKLILLSLGFIAIFVGLSSLCGFARLRLPIEPFLIMLSLMFWRQILGNERE